MSTSEANHSMAYAWVYYPGVESRVRSAASDSDRRCRERIGVSPYSPESVGFLFRDVGPARRASRCRREQRVFPPSAPASRCPPKAQTFPPQHRFRPGAGR